jgi:hypothetical protein
MALMLDQSLDVLLNLDGEVFAVDDGPFWTKFVVKRVPVTQERPHGLRYSLTLHDGDGERIFGFDNAHAVRVGSGPGARGRLEHDHRHRLDAVGHYEYTNAGTLLTDFWEAVFAFLKEER